MIIKNGDTKAIQMSLLIQHLPLKTIFFLFLDYNGTLMKYFLEKIFIQFSS